MALTLPTRTQIPTPPAALLGLILPPNPASRPTAPPRNRAISPVMAAILGARFDMPADGFVPEGERNNCLTRIAGFLKAKGLSNDALPVALHAFNLAKCSPPLDSGEVEQIANSIAKYPSNSAAMHGGFNLADGLITLSAQIPPPRTAIWGDIIIAGKYVVLAGPGGVSKTMLAIGLAVQIALGMPWASRDVLLGAAILILGEEDKDEVNRRVNAITRNLSTADKQSIERLLRVIPANGRDLRLVHLEQGNAEQTDLGERIAILSEELANDTGTPVRLIVIDHARLAISGDLNDASHVTELTRVLTSIADRTGAAVMLLAHSPKATLGKDDDDINAADVAGSSAFVDNSRCTMVMTTMKPQDARTFGIPEQVRQNYARLAVVKNNYGKTGTKIYFHRRYDPDFQVSPLEPLALQPVPKAGAQGQQALGNKIIDIVKQVPAPLTPTKLRNHYSGKSGTLNASEAEVEAAIKKLVSDGQLELRPPTPEEREQHNLHKNVRKVLWPGKVQGEGCGA